jgi:hypothetical protein
VRAGAVLAALALAAGCGGEDGGRAAPAAVVCEVHGRETAGAQLRGGPVTLRLPADEEVIERGGVSVRLLASTERGTAGAIVVAVLDGEGRERARGLYQLGEQVEDQFAGGHGFTGLVAWSDPETGAEIQFFCATG